MTTSEQKQLDSELSILFEQTANVQFAFRATRRTPRKIFLPMSEPEIPQRSLKDLIDTNERNERLLEQISVSLKVIEDAAKPKPSKLADLWLAIGILWWIAILYISPGIHAFTNLCLLILTIAVLNLSNRWF